VLTWRVHSSGFNYSTSSMFVYCTARLLKNLAGGSKHAELCVARRWHAQTETTEREKGYEFKHNTERRCTIQYKFYTHLPLTLQTQNFLLPDDGRSSGHYSTVRVQTYAEKAADVKQIWRTPKTKTVERIPMTMEVHHDNFL
jgi:hypothetical protein